MNPKGGPEMKVFQRMESNGHEQVAFCYDRVSGLKAIIAIHDTTLGPGLGGCRMWPYESEEEALVDALRLAEGMTYKSSVMGLNLGGGKAVIIGDPKDKSEVLLRAFGKFVQSLGGRYITAEDVSISPEDLVHVAMETDHVVGLPGGSGDPSPATAYGTFQGMKACLEMVYGSSSFRGRTVSVQGAGAVGWHLCRHLSEAGAQLLVSDIFPDKARTIVDEFGARMVEAEEIYDQEVDIFSPNALGSVINDDTLPRLRCRIVAGAANNQLAQEQHGLQLKEKGILYAPDFVINGGGVTNVADEQEPSGYNRERAYARIEKIYDKVEAVLETARDEDVPTHQAALRLAVRRIEEMGRLRTFYLPR